MVARSLKTALLLLCFLCAPLVAAQNPDLVQLFEQVAAQIRDNRLAEAEKELTSILKVSPDLPIALNFMGTIRAKQGRLNDAELFFSAPCATTKTSPARA